METLAPLIRQYVSGRRKRSELTPVSARSIEARLHSLSRSFGARPLSQFGPKAIERWQEQTGEMTPGARASYLSAVRVFCRWLHEEGHVPVDACAKVQPVPLPRRVPRALDPEDVALVLKVCPDERAEAIVMLMVGCGLRCAEVAGLTVNRWNRRTSTLEVKGKGGHERVLPVPPDVGQAIERYLAIHPATAGPMFRSYTRPSRGLRPNYVSRIVSEWFEEAGVKQRPWDGRSAHALRHTAASDVLDHCGDLRVVMEMLGHSSLAVTSIYQRRANVGQLREAMAGRDYRHPPPAQAA